jgi:acetyl esterase/lipase
MKLKLLALTWLGVLLLAEVAFGAVPAKFEMPFTAASREDALAWQQRARARLLELVEKQAPRARPADVPIDQVGARHAVHLREAQDRGEYTLYPATFQGNDKTGVSVLLTVPKGPGPFPAMVCLHGHGGAAGKVFDPKECYHAFADRFARGGYVVLAPSLLHRKYAATALWDLMRCVDILASRPDVDAERIGAAGLSMGGEWTMWLAACDPRVKAAVISGWMCTTAGVFSVPNCECWALPGFVELMDVCEVNLLIAPRPVLFESADADGCFPVRYTKEGFARLRAGYKVFGAETGAVHDVFPGVHEWHGTLAFPFIDKALGGHAAK